MVKIRGKKVEFTTSNHVSKELSGASIGRKRKRLAKGNEAEAEEAAKKLKSANEVVLPETRKSDEAPVKKGRWRNRQRVLIFGSRGIVFRGRHIMDNLRRLLPHTKKESKMDKRDKMVAINEICEMKNCNQCLFFEGRKTGDIYLWMSNIPEGPSVKFLVENASTMEELKFTGNCLKGSRALLSFDPTFDTVPHYQLMKEMFVKSFGTPYHYPKSQPFIDHVFTFTILDNRVWFRNFLIMEEDGSLVEIGPRFVLNPIRIFAGSFNGKTIWSNPHYVTPGKYRSQLKKENAGKYADKVQQKVAYELGRPKVSYDLDPTDEIFHVDPEQLNSAQ